MLLDIEFSIKSVMCVKDRAYCAQRSFAIYNSSIFNPLFIATTLFLCYNNANHLNERKSIEEYET